jgi:hypothetical protein
MYCDIRREENNLGIGGKLQWQTEAWREIKGDYLFRQGMQPEWEGTLSPPWQPPTRARRMYTGVMHTEYMNQLNEELADGIIVETRNDQCAWISPTFLVPKRGGQWRKILDCRSLNRYVKKESFQMEDQRTVVQLLERDQWTVSIDISKAYHHVSVSPAMQPYLSFQYGDRFFQ